MPIIGINVSIGLQVHYSVLYRYSLLVIKTYFENNDDKKY